MRLSLRKRTHLKSWAGDQWKIGGGSTWGWYSYDPKLNLIYYGTANPSTWNPVQRAGPDGKPIDQKWTMAIFARDPDTGMAKWIYQMTPFDEWDAAGLTNPTDGLGAVGGYAGLKNYTNLGGVLTVLALPNT